MCLVYSESGSAVLKEKLAAGPQTFYKTYKVRADGSIRSPVRETLVEPDAEGYIHSDRHDKTLSADEIEMRMVDHGIHVYLSDPGYLQRIEILVPVTGALDDFVAANAAVNATDHLGAEAVFTKIHVDQAKLKELVDRKVAEMYDPSWRDDDEDDDDDYWDDDDDDDEEE
jgi:hypothetical protein